MLAALSAMLARTVTLLDCLEGASAAVLLGPVFIRPLTTHSRQSLTLILPRKHFEGAAHAAQAESVME